MRRVLSLVFILLLPGVLGATLEDHWVFKGQPFSASGITVYAYPSEDYASLLLQVNGTPLLLSLHECREAMRIRFCYADIAPVDDVEHTRSTSEGVLERAVLVQTLPLGGRLVMHATIGTARVTHPLQGVVRLANEGNKVIENVTLRVRLNDTTLVLTQCTPHCSYTPLEGEARLGSLVPEEEKSVNLTFQPRGTGSVSVSLHAEGIDATGVLLTVDKDLPVGIRTPLDVWVNASVQELETGRSAAWEVRVQNTATQPLPLTIHVVKPRLLSMTHNLTNTTLQPNETITFTLRSVAYYSGTYPFSILISTLLNDEPLEENVTVKDVRVSHTLEVLPLFSQQNVVSNTRGVLRVKVKNTAGKAFRNITLTLVGLVNTTIHVPSMGINEERIVFETPLAFPNVSTRRVFAQRVYAAYKTYFDEDVSSSGENTITVYPLNESIRVTRSVQPAKPGVNETFHVTLRARVLVDQPVKTSGFYEEIEGARIIAGGTSTTRQPRRTEDVLYGYTAMRTAPYTRLTTRSTFYLEGMRENISWTWEIGKREEEMQNTPSEEEGTEGEGMKEKEEKKERGGKEKERSRDTTTQRDAQSSRAERKGWLDTILDFFLTLLS